MQIISFSLISLKQELKTLTFHQEQIISGDNIYHFLNFFFLGCLSQILKDIADEEANIVNLKKAIKDKEAHLKVAHTRLFDRSFRPNIELCRDEPQFR